MRRSLLTALMLIAASMLGACTLPGRDPVQVTVAGIDTLPGEGLELRMMVKLRVQNPNDTPIDFDGVSVRLDVLDKTFATGVSDERGTIPRFGEAVVSVPVTASALRLVVQGLSVMQGKTIDKVNYTLEGKLHGPMFGSTTFKSQGELALPGMASP